MPPGRRRGREAAAPESGTPRSRVPGAAALIDEHPVGEQDGLPHVVRHEQEGLVVRRRRPTRAAPRPAAARGPGRRVPRTARRRAPPRDRRASARASAARCRMPAESSCGCDVGRRARGPRCASQTVGRRPPSLLGGDADQLHRELHVGAQRTATGTAPAPGTAPHGPDPAGRSAGRRAAPRRRRRTVQTRQHVEDRGLAAARSARGGRRTRRLAHLERCMADAPRRSVRRSAARRVIGEVADRKFRRPDIAELGARSTMSVASIAASARPHRSRNFSAISICTTLPSCTTRTTVPKLDAARTTSATLARTSALLVGEAATSRATPGLRSVGRGFVGPSNDGVGHCAIRRGRQSEQLCKRKYPALGSVSGAARTSLRTGADEDPAARDATGSRNSAPTNAASLQVVGDEPIVEAEHRALHGLVRRTPG